MGLTGANVALKTVLISNKAVSQLSKDRKVLHFLATTMSCRLVHRPDIFLLYFRAKTEGWLFWSSIENTKARVEQSGVCYTCHHHTHDHNIN